MAEDIVEYSYLFRFPRRRLAVPNRSPLVGRERELLTLGRLVEQAHAGRGAVALIEGEPGIGKSRLLDEVLGSARSLGFEVMLGAGEELERDRPFGPITAALGLAAEASDPRRAAIARFLRAGQDASDAWERGPGLRYQVLDSILDLVEDLATTRPIALGLDDMQWADLSTLLVVRHLGPRLTSLPVVLLMVSRPVPRAGELAGVIEALRREGLVQLELGPLSSSEVAELAGSTVQGELTSGFLSQLSGAAGNPLLVTELVSAVQDGGGWPGDEARGGVVPATFADAILRRLRFLSTEAIHVLRLASVLGSAFSVADLALVLGRPVTDLVAPLDEARGAHLLVELDDRLGFRHDLIRDSIYADLPASVRKELHAHAARVLGAAGRSARQVAVHVTRGAAPGDAEAIGWLHRAARESLELEPAVAADLLERARALGGPTSASPQLLTELLMTYVWLGRFAEAESLGKQLIAADGVAQDTHLRRLFLARAVMSQGRGQEGLTILEPALRDAAIPDGVRAALFAMGTTLRVVVGDAEGARVLGAEGVRLSERSGDFGNVALNLATLGMAERAAGNPLRAVDLASRAVDLVGRARHVKPRVVTLYNLAARVLLDADRMDEAASVGETGRRLMEEHGIVLGQAECHCLQAERLLHIGQWDDAGAEAETTVDLCTMFEAWHAFGMAKSILALMATRRNELKRAESHVAAARDRLASAPDQHGRPWVRWTTGLFLEAKGDDHDALRSLLDAWSDSEGIVSDEATFGPDLVRLALHLGERRLAEEASARLEAAAAKAGLSRIDGAAMLCRGLVHDDVDALGSSVQANRAITRPYELARSCEATGTALGRLGSREDGVAYLRESIEIYERLGATRDVVRVEASLRALGAPRGRVGRRRRPETGWRSLTATETSVVQLVADGLRNRDIADRLFISRRTVETHLTHIFRKVQVSSRTELVAESSRQGPAELRSSSRRD
jgi:DNA-binding CsgD family transcriptional regulator/tetratricopeptide (TPR) repeat protein